MKKRKFKQFDHVELIVENEKYFDVHKGTRGYIMDLYGDSAAEIDFIGIPRTEVSTETFSRLI